jgi:hypothetical protein
MKETRLSLCPTCDACPEVVVAQNSVLIGEAGNQVRLAVDEWNVLVAAVKDGTLGLVDAKALETEGCGCDCGCEH